MIDLPRDQTVLDEEQIKEHIEDDVIITPEIEEKIKLEKLESDFSLLLENL